MPLINFEINLKLTRSSDCAKSSNAAVNQVTTLEMTDIDSINSR